MFQLANSDLFTIAPSAPKSAYAFVQWLNKTFELFDISTPNRIACFLAQCAHESGGFRYTTEISSGSQYEGRKDLGNIKVGDGVLFKGRGIIQITGRELYGLCSKVLYPNTPDLILLNPELLSTPQNACASAGWFWQYKKLNEICDLPESWTTKHGGKTYTMFEWLTYHINGGLNGLDNRLAYYSRTKQLMKL